MTTQVDKNRWEHNQALGETYSPELVRHLEKILENSNENTIDEALTDSKLDLSQLKRAASKLKKTQGGEKLLQRVEDTIEIIENLINRLKDERLSKHYDSSETTEDSLKSENNSDSQILNAEDGSSVTINEVKDQEIYLQEEISSNQESIEDKLIEKGILDENGKLKAGLSYDDYKSAYEKEIENNHMEAQSITLSFPKEAKDFESYSEESDIGLRQEDQIEVHVAPGTGLSSDTPLVLVLNNLETGETAYISIYNHQNSKIIINDKNISIDLNTLPPKIKQYFVVDGEDNISIEEKPKDEIRDMFSSYTNILEAYDKAIKHLPEIGKTLHDKSKEIITDTINLIYDFHNGLIEDIESIDQLFSEKIFKSWSDAGLDSYDQALISAALFHMFLLGGKDSLDYLGSVKPLEDKIIAMYDKTEQGLVSAAGQTRHLGINPNGDVTQASNTNIINSQKKNFDDHPEMILALILMETEGPRPKFGGQNLVWRKLFAYHPNYSPNIPANEFFTGEISNHKAAVDAISLYEFYLKTNWNLELGPEAKQAKKIEKILHLGTNLNVDSERLDQAKRGIGDKNVNDILNKMMDGSDNIKEMIQRLFSAIDSYTSEGQLRQKLTLKILRLLNTYMQEEAKALVMEDGFLEGLKARLQPYALSRHEREAADILNRLEILRDQQLEAQRIQSLSYQESVSHDQADQNSEI